MRLLSFVWRTFGRSVKAQARVHISCKSEMFSVFKFLFKFTAQSLTSHCPANVAMQSVQIVKHVLNATSTNVPALVVEFEEAHHWYRIEGFEDEVHIRDERAIDGMQQRHNAAAQQHMIEHCGDGSGWWSKNRTHEHVISTKRCAQMDLYCWLHFQDQIQFQNENTCLDKRLLRLMARTVLLLSM